MLDEEVVLIDIFSQSAKISCAMSEPSRHGVAGFRLDGCVALVTGARPASARRWQSRSRSGRDVAAHGNTRSASETCARVEALGRRAAP